MITEIIQTFVTCGGFFCVFFKQSWLGIKLQTNTSLAEHEIGFGYAAFCTQHTITQACPLVAALSRTHEDNKVHYTTDSLLLYLEQTTVGAFSSSVAGYKYDRPISILSAPNDKQKNIYTFNSTARIFWSEWDEKALHKQVQCKLLRDLKNNMCDAIRCV